MEKEMQGAEIPLTETGQNGQLGGSDSHTDPPLPNTSMERLLSTREVAELLNIHEKMVYTLVAEKGLPATKITGKGQIVRPGQPITGATMRAAVEGSLKRMGTDYIDLYQLHWPERSTNFFGQLGYKHKIEANLTPLEDTLEALDEQVKAGKIRHIGLSNETPWGTMRFLALAEARGWPRAVSIQNPYNLLNRSFEIGLAEIAIREQCGLLAYSPLAFGFLSGKYEGGARPPKGRLSLYSRFSRYFNPQSQAACSRYVALAREHGLDPAQMALAFVTQQPFVTSNIIGATTLEQLDSNIASFDLTLSDEVLAGIEAIHKDHPNPAP